MKTKQTLTDFDLAADSFIQCEMCFKCANVRGVNNSAWYWTLDDRPYQSGIRHWCATCNRRHRMKAIRIPQRLFKEAFEATQ